MLEIDPLPALSPLLTAVCAAGHRAGQIDGLLGRRPPYAPLTSAKEIEAGRRVNE
jgi:hypothetical protein